MKKLLVFGVIMLSACSTAPKKTYSNPLDVAFGDPYVIKASDGQYYMYGTTNDNGFRAYVSDNMIDWSDCGLVYEKTNDSWGVDCFWAPEVYERDGKFYMFFSANWRENPEAELEMFRIGIAEADSPTGPFKEMSDKPLWDPGYPVIDGNLLFDDDGRVFLYYSRCCYKNPVESEVAQWARTEGLFNEIEESWVYVVELSPQLDRVISEPVLVLSPPKAMNDPQSEWESRSVTHKEVNRRWTEGSFILKQDGLYYLMYSANYFGGAHYAVGYATSTSPLGPFAKASNNPVLQKNIASGGNVTGTGHNSVVTLDNGNRYCVYHGRTTETGDQRVVFIDKMDIRNGVLTIDGPTTSAIAIPE